MCAVLNRSRYLKWCAHVFWRVSAQRLMNISGDGGGYVQRPHFWKVGCSILLPIVLFPQIFACFEENQKMDLSAVPD